MVTKYGCCSSRAYHGMRSEFKELIDTEYPDIKVFVTGGRRYDPLPNTYSREVEVLNFSPDFRKYPKGRVGFRAFYVRNKQIAYVSDVLIALWDGKSKGTKMTIDLARGFGKEVHVYTWSIEEQKFTRCE